MMIASRFAAPAPCGPAPCGTAYGDALRLPTMDSRPLLASDILSGHFQWSFTFVSSGV